MIARLHAAHSSQGACGGGRDLAIKVAQQFNQRRHDIASRADAVAADARTGEFNVAGASAPHRVEILRQAPMLQSPQLRELALGRCPWRSIDRRIEKRRARQSRQGPLTLRLAPAPCNRRHSRRNDCKESQARSLRPSAAAFRLQPQAHKRQRAPSSGERRSPPRQTSFEQTRRWRRIRRTLGRRTVSEQFELGMLFQLTKLSRITTPINDFDDLSSKYFAGFFLGASCFSPSVSVNRR